ncbi:MAG: hypothetical protein ACLQGJ_06280 [Candidatus Dormibacteria bacterium]
MMNPHLDLLLAHERHLDLIRRAEISRLAREASRSRSPASLSRLPARGQERGTRRAGPMLTVTGADGGGQRGT